jgi:adenosine deaminase
LGRELFDQNEDLIELHTHLGGAVDSATMWEIAHEQGIKLPYSDFFEFEAATNVSDGTDGLEGLNKVYHFTELIQSSPEGVQRATYQALAHAYRTQRISKHEVRFNPAKRNRGGERDLDAIILAAIHGMDRATVDYGIQAGIILMMDRCQSIELNAAIVKRAIKFKDRGIVGVDIGGPRPSWAFYDYPQSIGHMVEKAKTAGLGVTIHAGEEGCVDEKNQRCYFEETRDVIDYIKPDRIGHGILIHRYPELMEKVVAQDVLLEICPTSNIRTGAVQNWGQMAEILDILWDNGVKFTLCTDGPVMIGTTLRGEYNNANSAWGMTLVQARKTQEWAQRASFI